jgi:predicted double-glycine peptidase
MKRITQEDKYGCGIACVAMVADCGYRAVKRQRQFRGLDLDKRGTFPKQLIDALNDRGVRTSGRFKKLEGRNKKAFLRRNKKNAIVRALYPGLKSRWHWIVWDADRKRWIDPECDPEERYDRPRVQSYLEID